MKVYNGLFDVYNDYIEGSWRWNRFVVYEWRYCVCACVALRCFAFDILSNRQSHTERRVSVKWELPLCFIQEIDRCQSVYCQLTHMHERNVSIFCIAIRLCSQNIIFFLIVCFRKCIGFRDCFVPPTQSCRKPKMPSDRKIKVWVNAKNKHKLLLNRPITDGFNDILLVHFIIFSCWSIMDWWSHWTKALIIIFPFCNDPSTKP